MTAPGDTLTTAGPRRRREFQSLFAAGDRVKIDKKKVFNDQSEVAISAYDTARSTVEGAPLSSDALRKIDAYWRASLYLCMGMLYLKNNLLLWQPLELEHTKPPRLLGLRCRPVLHLTFTLTG